MHCNQHLRREVFATLNAEEEEYMVEYNAKKTEAAKAKSAKKEADNKAHAKAFVEKQKNTEAE